MFMLSRKSFAAVVVLVSLGVAVYALQAQIAAVAPAARPGTQWQYAQLSMVTTGDAEAVNFLEPGKVMHARSVADLHKALTGRAPARAPGEGAEATAEASVLDILNAIGARGWELVALETTSGRIDARNYLFKKPVN